MLKTLQTERPIDYSIRHEIAHPEGVLDFRMGMEANTVIDKRRALQALPGGCLRSWRRRFGVRPANDLTSRVMWD